MQSWFRLLIVLLLSAAALTAEAQSRRQPAPPRKRPAVAVVDSSLLDPAPYVFSRQDSLLLAAATNDVPLAERLLAHGADVNQPYHDTLNYLQQRRELPENKLVLPDWTQVYEGTTPLHLAVQRGHLALADLLLRHGADPRLLNRWQQSALCQALSYVPNQVALVERLLATGVPLDSCRCNEPLLNALIGYNARMRQQYANAQRWRPAETPAARRRRRHQMGAARRYEEPLHPLRPDSVSLQLLRLLLAAGARPTPAGLNLAIRSREPALARYLLTHGVGVNRRDPASGNTPLHEATAQADTVLLRLLLDQGANPNIAGSVPTMVAANADWSLATKVVPDDNFTPEPDFQDGMGSTPLHEAVRASRPAVVRLLLAAGANPNACDAGQQSPLQMAVECYPVTPAEYSPPVVISDEDWTSPAPPPPAPPGGGSAGQPKDASRRADADEVLRQLLAAGASPGLTGPNGGTVLQQAVVNDDTLRVGLLLRAGADPNQPYPLTRYIMGGYVARAGVDPRQPGYPPLVDVRSMAVLRQLQAAGGRFGLAASVILFNQVVEHRSLPPAIAAAALADGGSLRGRGSYGETPLHLLVESPNADLATVLLYLAHGADPNATTPFGWTPLAAAASSQRLALVQQLLDAGARPATDPSALTVAADLGNEAVVQLLLRHGAPVNHPDQLTCATPLLAAIESASTQPGLVAELLAAGADPNVADTLGYSPLHRLLRQHAEATRQLGENTQWGAATSASPQVDAQPTAAQQQAAADARLLALARLLLAHGARPDSRNLAGESVLEVLRASSSPAARQVLAELEQPANTIQNHSH